MGFLVGAIFFALAVLSFKGFLKVQDGGLAMLSLLGCFLSLVIGASFIGANIEYLCRPPICEVRKTPVDIDIYQYTLYEKGEKIDSSMEVKPFLEKCSQIQRKKKWLETHKEEILMEVE